MKSNEIGHDIVHNKPLHLTAIPLALQCVKKNCGSSSCCTKDEGRPLGIDVRA
jgi:hypothetical protein